MTIKITTPKVEIISYAPDALELLLFTKSTRLQGQSTLDDIKNWPIDKKLSHLAYMRDTIKSSWEFVDYVFNLTGVSRVFTHQFVRTRDQAGIDDPAFGSPDANPAVASYAQEAQRTIDASENGFTIPTGAKNTNMYSSIYEQENECYKQAIADGESYQDARYLLPNSVSTSIIAKLSLRALHHMAEVRLCTRAQGEYQKVFRLMRSEVYRIHPWTSGWIEVYCVNHGTCCFPRYEKCPVQGPLFNPEIGSRFDRSPFRPVNRKEILTMWENTSHEADPVAKDGRTQ